MLQESIPGEHVLDTGQVTRFVGIIVGVQNLPVCLPARIQNQNAPRRVSVVEPGEEHEVMVLGVGHEELVEVGLRPVGAGDDGQASAHSFHQFGSAFHGRFTVAIPVFQGPIGSLGLGWDRRAKRGEECRGGQDGREDRSVAKGNCP